MKTRIYAAPAVNGLKSRICHFANWQIRPFNTKVVIYCISVAQSARRERNLSWRKKWHTLVFLVPEKVIMNNLRPMNDVKYFSVKRVVNPFSAGIDCLFFFSCSTLFKKKRKTKNIVSYQSWWMIFTVNSQPIILKFYKHSFWVLRRLYPENIMENIV